MHMDPLMPALVGIVFAVLALGLVLHRFRQPSIVAYLVTGTLLGPNGLGVVTDATAIARLGEIGVVLLLFFGAPRIPPIGKGLGEGIRNFKGSIKEDQGKLPGDGGD